MKRSRVGSFGISFAALVAIVAGPASVQAAPLSNIVAIAAGSSHTCALTSAGGVKCWGANGHGQLGDGTTADRSTAVDVTGLTSGVIAISAGLIHTCALTTAGGMKCWGSGAFGALGDGTTVSPRVTPVEVVGLTSGVAAISAGHENTCALMQAGGVKCWGKNFFGEVGDGTATARTSPVDVQGLTSGVKAMGTSQIHSCALTSVGGMKCWGSNGGGELGDGTRERRLTPVDVSGLPTEALSFALGGGFTCALLAGGGVKCWGNWFGLGNGATSGFQLTPADVQGLTSGVSAIAAGTTHTCAVTTGGGAKCWGENSLGKLGDGTTTSRYTPVDVIGLTSGVLAISPGYAHTCALLSGGTVKCWGWGKYGTLGNGATPEFEPLPTTVGTLPPQTIALASPTNRNISEGPYTLVASASSGLAVNFISMTPAVCTVAGANVTPVAIGICTIRASQSGDLDYAAATQVDRSFLVLGSPAGAAPRLRNISTRMQVLSGSDSLIGGFVISGNHFKTVVIRARGPSLRSSGVSNALANPALRIFYGQTMFASNDDWQSGSSAALLQSIGLAPADVLESAVLVTLAPGPYTAIVDGVDGATGVGIVEVFEIDRADVPLVNISTRGRVLTGEDVMITGWVIEGTSPQTVVVRARGPSLAAFGLTDLLANPMLQLVRSSDQVQIAVNDDWGTASNAAQLSASGFAPSNAQEAAILITLQPGAYTAIVTGVGGGTGVGIVEVFRQ